MFFIIYFFGANYLVIFEDAIVQGQVQENYHSFSFLKRKFPPASLDLIFLQRNSVRRMPKSASIVSEDFLSRFVSAFHFSPENLLQECLKGLPVPVKIWCYPDFSPHLIFSRETLLQECLKGPLLRGLLVPEKICLLSLDLGFSLKAWSPEQKGFSRQNIFMKIFSIFEILNL